MNITETYPHGVQTRTFNGDTGTLYYHVLVDGRVVWSRHSRPDTRDKHRLEIATAQRQWALHLVAVEESRIQHEQEQERRCHYAR